MRRLSMLGVAIAVLVAGSAEAAVRRVPSEYPTIQAGLDASVAGDTVLVAPGTYTDWETRVIGTLGSWTSSAFLVDGVALRSEGGPAVTTIDMSAAAGPQEVVVLAMDLFSDQTLLEGFTITGSQKGLSHWGSQGLGGPTPRLRLRDCIFRDMDAGGSSGAGANANGDIVLEGCEFVNCRARVGGGVYQAHGRIEMYDCVVRDCGQTGVLLSGSIEPPVESCRIERCRFEGCWAADNGGSGGLSISDPYLGEAIVRDCVFVDNEAQAGDALGKGSSGPGALVERCLFVGNRAVVNVAGAIAGGGLTIRSCTFVGNTAQYTAVGGGTIYLLGSAASSLLNNVIVGSNAPAIFAYNVPLTSSCNVFWQNVGGWGIYYTPGPTDREADPLFCDAAGGDYTVRTDSPCLPANSLGCGQIGAYGEGCGLIGVESISFGRLKGAYRGEEGGRP